MRNLWNSLWVATLLSSVTYAAPIFIDDPSFESPVINDGTSLTGRDMFCANNPPPWNVGPPCSGFGNTAWETGDHESDSNGVMNPTIGPLIPGFTSTSPNYPSIPDGDQIAYSHGSPFFQVLTTVIEPNTTYTLSFWAGQRQDAGYTDGSFIYAENQGYWGELAAGSSFDTRTPFLRTVAYKGTHYFGVDSLNTTNSAMPEYGEWILITISYTFGASDPLIGQQLIVSFGSPAVQANFDMVSIDATPTGVPEPGSYAMMAAGLGALAFWKRRTSLTK